MADNLPAPVEAGFFAAIPAVLSINAISATRKWLPPDEGIVGTAWQPAKLGLARRPGNALECQA
jgi:hypothetical protein